MSYLLFVPADDQKSVELLTVTEDQSIWEQACRLIDPATKIVERVRARGLHQLAPQLWPVMLVDDNGHAQGLPLNWRGEVLYGYEIAGNAVLCRSPWPDGDLEGFSREQAEELSGRLPRLGRR